MLCDFVYFLGKLWEEIENDNVVDFKCFEVVVEYVVLGYLKYLKVVIVVLVMDLGLLVDKL